MNTLVLTGIVTLLGIASTFIAWKLNPRRTLYASLDSIYKELEELYASRDKALAAHDGAALSIVTDRIIGLRNRKNTLLQRLG